MQLTADPDTRGPGRGILNTYTLEKRHERPAVLAYISASANNNMACAPRVAKRCLILAS